MQLVANDVGGGAKSTRVCRRRDILSPLAKVHDGSRYLRGLGLAAVGVTVLIIYAFIGVHWAHRSGGSRNPAMKALEAVGLVKKRVTKLV